MREDCMRHATAVLDQGSTARRNASVPTGRRGRHEFSEHFASSFVTQVHKAQRPATVVHARDNQALLVLHIYVYIYIYLFIYVCVCVCACMCIYVYVCICMSICICFHVAADMRHWRHHAHGLLRPCVASSPSRASVCQPGAQDPSSHRTEPSFLPSRLMTH